MFNIENQGANTFLTYTIKPEDEIDDLSLGMLTNNKINGVAPILYTQLNEERFLKYNISSKVPVLKLFNGIITRNRLLSVVSGILNSIFAAEEYMVDSSLLVLDSNHIYFDVTTYDVLLICLPIINKANNIDLRTFFKNIIFSGQYDQTENCDYVPVIINYLNSTEVFSTSDFKKLIDSLKASNKIAKETSIATPKSPVSANNVAEKPILQPPVHGEQHGDDRPRQRSVADFSVPEHIQAKPIVKPDNSIVEKQNKKEEPQMSLLYLVRHYSKENMEIYKAQKNNTSSKNETSKKRSMETPAKKTKNAEKKPKKTSAGFMIPGKQMDINSVKNEASEQVINSVQDNAEANPQSKKNYSSAFNSAANNSTASTKSADFGDTTILMAPGASVGETSLLTANVVTAVKPRPYLVRLKNGEKVLIDKPRFRIGKEKSYVDYFIGDNTAISRSHADIIVRGDDYYLVDLNSTNHTFVNGAVVQNGEERQIKNGNRIRFANEEFEFIEEI